MSRIRFGKMVLEQFGMPELAAALQYTVQGQNCEEPALLDIGAILWLQSPGPAA